MSKIGVSYSHNPQVFNLFQQNSQDLKPFKEKSAGFLIQKAPAHYYPILLLNLIQVAKVLRY